MNIKDFKVGDKVYIVEKIHQKETIREDEVIKVGNKYVTVKRDGLRFYLNNETDMFLTINRDWGEKELLFKDEQELKNYMEYKTLKSELYNKLCRLEKYSLNQLRKIKEIIEYANKV